MYQISHGLFFRFVLLVAVAFVPRSFAQRGGPAAVDVETVDRRSVASRQNFVANINPNRRATIGSAVDGRVEVFAVKAGQRVTTGQALAQLRTRTIEIEIAAAQAELELRQAELQERRNGARPDEISLAKAQSQAAVAADAYAKAKLKRLERLYSQSTGISRDEFESARADALAARARMDESRSSLRLTEAGPRQEQIDQAAARVAVQMQIVEGLKDRLDRYTLHAPFEGYVVTELTEVGAWLRQGDPVAEIIEINPVEAEVFVPESTVGFVRPGSRVDVTVSSLRDAVFAGTVDTIVPLADGRSRTFPVRVLIENPLIESPAKDSPAKDSPAKDSPAKDSPANGDASKGSLANAVSSGNGRHRLLPGMIANVSLPTDDASQELMVPKDALQFTGNSSVVYKVVDGKAEIIRVEAGTSDNDWIAVKTMPPGSLAEGDRVVTRGNERLRPGQEVAIRNEP